MFKIIARILITLILASGIAIACYYGYPATPKTHSSWNKSDIQIELKKLQSYSAKAKLFCKKKGFNCNKCFFADMSLPGGKNRLFEYDMLHDSVISCGLVAHGSCNYLFLSEPEFSNQPGSGCTSLGRYKIGSKYNGKFGAAYKLYGLDTTNSNAYKRNIVLHSYYLIPDKEVDPLPVCNSLGCAMVSESYFKILSKTIDSSKKPILLWLF